MTPQKRHELARVRANEGRIVCGGPATVREALESLAASYGVEEIVVVTIVHNPAARRRSYELLAQTCGLIAAG